VFAFQKSAAEKAIKKSPLAGWLGTKTTAEDELPEINVAAGLARALRSANTRQEETPAADVENNPVREALSAIETTLYAIDDVRDILEQACDVVLSAKSVEEAGGRALLAESYDDLRVSINKSVNGTDDSAKVLIGKNQRHIDVNLGGKAHYSISAMRLDASERGLNLSPPRDAFATYDEIDQTLEELDKALAKADRTAANYCRDAQYLIARIKGALEA